MLKAQIENVLHRMYNISYNDAYNIWYKAVSTIDNTVVNIINMLIEQSCPDPLTGKPQGLPMIVNRNPTISYGSILQMFCIGINLNDYTMAVPLQILQLQAADFDGDNIIDKFRPYTVMYM